MSNRGYSTVDRWLKHPSRMVVYCFWAEGQQVFADGRTLVEAYREARTLTGLRPQRFRFARFVGELGAGTSVRKG